MSENSEIKAAFETWLREYAGENTAVAAIQLAGYLNRQIADDLTNVQAESLDSQQANDPNGLQSSDSNEPNPFSQLVSDSAIQQARNAIEPVNWRTQYAISDEDLIAIDLAPHENQRRFNNPAIQRVEKPAIEVVEPTEAVLNWCAANGWSDPHWVTESRDRYRWGQYGRWWAFEGADVQPKPLPYEAQTGKADVPVSGRAQLGTKQLRLTELCAKLRELRRTERFRFGHSSAENFAFLLDETLKLLRPDRQFVIAVGVVHHFDGYRLEMRIAQSERVQVRINSRPAPSRDPIVILELPLRLTEVEQLMQSAALEQYIIGKALNILGEFGLIAPVGTTEQSSRGFASENSLQATDQRNPNLPRACQCQWCQQRWQHFP